MILNVNDNIACCYGELGREEDALELRRQIYARSVVLSSVIPVHVMFIRVLNLSVSLRFAGRFTEAKSLLREQIPEARRALNANHESVTRLRWNYATCLCDDAASRDDLVEAVTLLEELSRTTQRIYGTSHPLATDIRTTLGGAREMLAAFDTSTSK